MLSRLTHHSLVSHMSSSTLDVPFDPTFAAREVPTYLDCGFSPIPLKGKVPWSGILPGGTWKGFQAAADALHYFPAGANLGVNTGQPHPHDPAFRLVAFDLDFAENDTISRDRVFKCLPPDIFPSRSGQGQRLHVLCMSDIEFPGNTGVIPIKVDVSYPFKPKELKARGHGLQSMMAGSLHPDTNQVTYWYGAALTDYTLLTLPRFSKYRFQELVAIFLEPEKPFHQFAQDDDMMVNVHNNIVSATSWMANNRWPEMDVTARMDLYWSQLMDMGYEDPDGRDERSFTTEYLTAFRQAMAKYSDENKPSKSARANGPSRNEEKLSPERMMADHWRMLNTCDAIAPRVDQKLTMRIYGGGWWKPVDPGTIMRDMGRIFDGSSGKKLSAAYDTLVKTSDAIPPGESSMLCMASSALDLATMQEHDHHPEHYLTTAVPFDYTPDAPCPVYDQLLADTFRQVQWGVDERTEDQLKQDETIMRHTWEEFAGYCMLNTAKFQKALFMVGPPASGKSLLAKTIEWVLPEFTDVTTVALDEFGDPRLRPEMLAAKVNICEDIDTGFAKSAGFIKAVVAGNRQSIRVLNQQKMEIVPTVKFMFIGNRLMRTSDTSDGIQRRMVVLLAPNEIKDDRDRDPDLELKLRPETPAIFSRYITAAHRLLQRGRFLHSHYQGVAIAENKRETNNVLMWMDENTHRPEDASQTPCGLLYADYVEWCSLNNHRVVSNNEWGKRLLLHDPELKTHVTRMGGTQYRTKRLKLNQMGAY